MALHIFCALKCEAEPIIDNFKLIRLNDFKLFKIYQSIDQETSLVITNVGKNNAKNAVAYHHDCIKTTKSDIWFNIGIAGHENIAIGEIRLINKIVDSDNKSCWYPQIIFDPPCDSIDLISLERPSNEYQTCLYDMEASGFYSAASQYGISELIHSVKVISDNTSSSISKINKFPSFNKCLYLFKFSLNIDNSYCELTSETVINAYFLPSLFDLSLISKIDPHKRNFFEF